MIDRAEIMVTAGDGGSGAMSFRREKFVPRGGPDGGDGGVGGSVVLLADTSLRTLWDVGRRRHWKADRGQHGRGSNMHGRRGKDLIIRVPVGTEVRRKKENGDLSLIGDLTEAGQTLVVAHGGLGGWGNAHFATSTNQAPRIAQRGQKGEEVRLVLDLKLLSDVGILGVPNAGKSTLLAAVSAAHPKIASYPFTTVEPVLGVVDMGYTTFVVAEIPGLLEGAHLGVGLGHDFLRHAERARMFVHLLDGTRPDPLQDMTVINGELAQFREDLAAKPQVVAVNKIDLPDAARRTAELRKLLTARQIKPFFISAITSEGVRPLLERVAQELSTLVEEEPSPTLPVVKPRPLSARFTVSVSNDVYRVSGERLEAFAEMMPLHQEEGRAEFWRRLTRWGVVAALKRAGIQPGARVRLGQTEVEWEG
ncbi:MAG: GTPase ObgE [Dehalococcoidia bacterium]|nr:MAG: GTPase ObgE [Dehalococcoidia bacterium]